MEVLQPCVVQVSGGEPLMREDLAEVVRNIKESSGLPYIILVSSWSLMTEERYLALRIAGVDQFSVSLDFPDSRHDDFRCYPGLYAHLNEVIPQCASHGYDDIVLNTCITAANLREINAAADQAEKWGVNICYSAYSARRTGNGDYLPASSEQLRILADQFERLEARRNGSNYIVSAPTTLAATQKYFEDGGMGGCKAGLRFLVVTADGKLQPCSMQFRRYELHEQAKMIEEFTSGNRCNECYVAIRSNLDKTFPQLLRENVRNYLSFGTQGSTAAGNC
jgi:MoaA/NifB/PqqE/SkfB family radical SAM enzyme